MERTAGRCYCSSNPETCRDLSSALNLASLLTDAAPRNLNGQRFGDNGQVDTWSVYCLRYVEETADFVV